jgi:hypothetical protein
MCITYTTQPAHTVACCLSRLPPLTLLWHRLVEDEELAYVVTRAREVWMALNDVTPLVGCVCVCVWVGVEGGGVGVGVWGGGECINSVYEGLGLGFRA